GANRLASNSLLEGLVFGARAAEAMTEPPRAAPLKADRVPSADWGLGTGGLKRGMQGNSGSTPIPNPQSLTPDEVRALMWHSVGLFRSRDDLARAAAVLEAAA